MSKVKLSAYFGRLGGDAILYTRSYAQNDGYVRSVRLQILMKSEFAFGCVSWLQW